ncbi:hypothetical protein KI387_035921 [Taxus chinensis]|uniref:Low-temperature-induced 65 kDa protein n=1 Tax=Taxus chinensis TaxID=29808 RepID=A0AA38FPW9_TAXCH|nr:hypothetical protein KI387_035921 [Taxus chinensis]
MGEEKMEGQTRIAEMGEHVEDGHEKKSMFHSMKDRVKKMNARVKKNIRERQGHRENLEESVEEDEEEEEEDQAPVTEIEETGTDVGIPSMTEKAEEVQAGATESAPQDKVTEAGEGNELVSNTKPSNVTEIFESGPSTNVAEEVESDQSAPSEIGFGVMSKASGLAQGSKGMFSSKKSSDDDDKDTALLGEHEEQEDGGPQQQETEAQGGDNAKEILEEFESNSGPKLSENPEEEESQKLVRGIQSKVSEGEGAELTSNTKSPNFSEEVNSGNIMLRGELHGKEDEELQQQKIEVEGEGLATGPITGENLKEEESQSLARKAQDKVSEVEEEVKSGTPETGSGFMETASGLTQGARDIFPRNQSNNENVKDTVLQGESKAQEDGGPHQQQSEAEAKTGQSYAQKLYAAKSAFQSKMGYGGQTNQKNSGTRELKSGGQTNLENSGSGTESMEDAKEGKKSPVVSKLSPGEDEKALSKLITETVSNSAKSVKDTIVGGFYGGKEKSPATTETTMDPSQSPTKSISTNASGGKGIMDRVTEVVGSLVGRKKGEDAQISPSLQKQELESVEKQMAELQVQDEQPTGKSELQKGESTPMEQ